MRVLGKPIDFSSSPDLFDDELPAEDAAASRATRVDLVAPIVTAAAPQREALLVLGTKRSEEPYDRDDRELVASVAASLAVLLERRPDEGETDDAFAECPQCGACDEVNATRCTEDGTPLVRVSIPRVLGGRYTIHRRLGRGGMGTVYEARDGALERRVAVKVIRDDMVGSPDAADRFRGEARVAASFAHPNVVTIYDFGITDNARGYLVMERLNGATLRETLRRDGRLAPSRTLHVMRGVCQAVDAAHRRQLVHRDLKPDNIFLTKEEVPKVLDFGIAKFVRLRAGLDRSHRHRRRRRHARVHVAGTGSRWRAKPVMGSLGARSRRLRDAGGRMPICGNELARLVCRGGSGNLDSPERPTAGAPVFTGFRVRQGLLTRSRRAAVWRARFHAQPRGRSRWLSHPSLAALSSGSTRILIATSRSSRVCRALLYTSPIPPAPAKRATMVKRAEAGLPGCENALNQPHDDGLRRSDRSGYMPSRSWAHMRRGFSASRFCRASGPTPDRVDGHQCGGGGRRRRFSSASSSTGRSAEGGCARWPGSGLSRSRRR